VNPFRIAFANIRFPTTPEESITLAEQAVDQAAIKGARIIGFPECFVPGYRGAGKHVPPPDPEFLERAWTVIAESAAKANIMVHPHFHEAEPDSYRPATFADPANTFHEKAVLCCAAENTCHFATVNCASLGFPITSAIVRPDGTTLSYQPYGEEGLLIADIDISTATGLLAALCRTGS
jgi:predicted amidohydrolase